jgi:prepilin-type N-terminal cleavage/methylation domain-containing protein
MKIRQRGFTIVELLVVIVVIAVLAAVVIFGYGAWRNQLATDSIKSDLTNAATAMESARNFGSGYPTDIPASYAASENSTVRYVMGDEGQFCLEGRSKVMNGIYYFIDSSKGTEPLEGTCAGGEGATPDWTIFVYDTTMPSCTTLTMQLPIISPTSAPGSEIDWGDGSTGTLTSGLPSHTYTTPGEKIVQYKGPITTINALSLAAAGRQCFKEIRQWSDSVTPTTVTFKGANNIQRVAEPPKSVTDMSEMFWSARTFNQNISSWDVSHVTSMRSMFFDARAFNQNINSWNVSNVTDMSSMFNGALVFNQPLDSWDVSKVTNMYGVFANTDAFNQPLNSWNTSNVTNMGGIFAFSDAFNQPLNAWNTSNVTDMSTMFAGSIYNQPIGSWNTSNVTKMGSMFSSNSVFNQPLNTWDTSKVTDMSFMFSNASSFNQSLNSWNTANVTNMSTMFSKATAFNGSIGAWNTSKVTNMMNMFKENPSFNQPIGSWNTALVSSMTGMFQYATSFNQNLSGWNISSITSRPPVSFDANATSWTLPRPVW